MFNKSLIILLCNSIRRASTMNVIDSKCLEEQIRCLAPKLSLDMHKGQAGRIGIVGGSIEYTGAPYFAGITGLKLGADLIHVFCAKEASAVIKSYSPELIVHPLLDDNIEKVTPWLERLHVLVIGPGLGRDKKILDNVEKLIETCRKLNKPLVIDADGLFLVTTKPDVIKNYPNVILTPNVVEFSRLFGENCKDISVLAEEITKKFGRNCVVVKKGKIDEIISGCYRANCAVIGSARRCGGQGDLLSGSLAVFYNWAILKNKDETSIFAACYAACKLTRECNARAFKKFGRSMTTSDMIQEIGEVFKDSFDN